MKQNNERLNNPHYKSLTRRMVLFVIIVSFTPMLLVGGINFDQFYITYREKVHAHLAELILKHKQSIDDFLKKKLGDIKFLAACFNFEQLSDETFLRDKLGIIQREYAAVFEDLGVINDKGIQVAYAGPFKLINADYSDADWFKKAIQSQYFISDVFMGLRGRPHFIIAVRSSWQGKDWILRSTINFMTFNSLVENLRIGKTGFAFILNKEGKFQTEPAFDTRPGDTQYNFLQKAKKNKEGIHITEKKDELGKKNIYVGTYLKEGDWMLIFQQNTDDAFSTLNQTQKIAVMIFLIGGICIIVMSFVLSKRMVSRIANLDSEKEMMNQQIIETGKLASIGELAAGIAHEINNPVAIMVEEAGWIQDLLEEEDLKKSESLEEFQRALKQINTQGKRCKEITHKLLSFARKTDSQVHDLQINELIEDVAELSGQRAKYSNVTIRTNLQDEIPNIKMSHTELQQVLLNLINNALDAMEKKGEHLI